MQPTHHDALDSDQAFQSAQVVCLLAAYQLDPAAFALGQAVFVLCREVLMFQEYKLHQVAAVGQRASAANDKADCSCHTGASSDWIPASARHCQSKCRVRLGPCAEQDSPRHRHSRSEIVVFCYFLATYLSERNGLEPGYSTALEGTKVLLCPYTHW